MKLPNLPEKLIILGLTLAAFLLRAYRLDFQSFWIDEAWTVYFAHLSIGELWHLLQTTEIMPPLYHPSTIYWLRLVGDSEYALRFYSLVFGVMAVPLTYRLGKDLGDDRLGLILALLMTVAPYQIWHSQEARMYSMLTASSVMSMWGFVNLWQRGGWRWWLIYIVGTEWAVMTHYHAAILIGIQGLFLLLTWRRHWRGYLRWGASLILVFLLYVPWLLFGSNLLQSYVNWIEPATLWESLVRSAIAYSLGELVPRSQAIPLTLVFVAVYGLGLLYVTRRAWGLWSGWEMLALLVSYTIAPHFAAWIYGELKTVVYFERYMILIQVGYLLTIAIGLLALLDGLPMLIQPRRQHQKQNQVPTWSGYLAASLLLLLLLGISSWVLTHHYYDPAYAKPDWRAAAQTIEDYGLPGDAILLTGDGGENAFNYYYEGKLPVYASFNLLPPTHPDYKLGRPGVANAEQIMSELAADHRRIWYLPYGVDIDATLESWLAENTYPAWHSWIGRKRLGLYAGRASTDRLEMLNHTFADTSEPGPTLVSAAMSRGSIAAGDLLPLTLTWQTSKPLEREYQLSLRLSNNYGDIFAQSDWPPLAAVGATSTWPANQPIIDRRSLWLPPDLPPGQYVLQFIVYDPATGQPWGKPASLNNIGVEAAAIVVPPEALSIPNRIKNPKSEIENPVLMGYAMPEKIQPGQPMWLWIYWQATAPIEAEAVRLSLTTQGEAVSTDIPLSDPLGPLDSWQPGQVRRAVYHLPTSPRLTGEQAELSLALISATGQAAAAIPLSQVTLENRVRRFELPRILQSTDVALGQPALLKLVGYDLPPTGLGPGQTLPVTLYWQAETEMEVNYTVFVQLLNNEGQIVAQLDLPPQAGAAPTTTWLPGEILTDPYSLGLPVDLPPGHYRLITGLYNPATGERLPTGSGGDLVELGEVTVE